MLILEYKLRANKSQQAAIDEAIRTTQFVRNKALRLWMDTRGVGQYQLQALCAQLAQDFPFAARLNSMARQAAADRAWAAIARFYKNCRNTSRARRATLAFSMTTALLSTKRRAGNWERMGNTSPTPSARHGDVSPDWYTLD